MVLIFLTDNNNAKTGEIFPADAVSDFHPHYFGAADCRFFAR